MLRVIAFLAVAPAVLALGQEPVHRLQDRNCGKNEQLAGLFDGVAVYARCDDSPAGQIMHIAVENRGGSGVTGFSIGFCDNPIIEVAAAANWTATRSPGDVDFAVSDAFAVPAATRIDGFTVTLRRPWIRSWSMTVQRIDGVAATETSHDCQ